MGTIQCSLLYREMGFHQLSLDLSPFRFSIGVLACFFGYDAWRMAFDLFGVGWLGRLESCFVLFFLVSFWIFDLGIDMDFITLSFFYMSTRDFIGDGHFSSHDFRLYHLAGGSISPFGGKEPHYTSRCT